MSTDFDKAVARISEVVMFENWLRFYFIAEADDEALVIRIPEQAFEKIRKLYPHLAGLAEKLHDETITHEKSLREICLFVASEIDGVSLSESTIQKVFASDAFQMTIQLFGTWVQAHEEQLDQNFTDFGSWKQMFETWKQTDKVQDYIRSVQDTLARTATTGSSTTQ